MIKHSTVQYVQMQMMFSRIWFERCVHVFKTIGFIIKFVNIILNESLSWLTVNAPLIKV